MKNIVEISVILTSYNHEKHVREAIDSVLNQTFSNFELIIWDDASTDSSWDIIQSYSDPRIKAFRNPENKRGIFGLNKAIHDTAQGKYIAVHHSDDVWEKDKLQKQYSFLEANQNIGAVFSNAHIINEDSEPFIDETHFYFKIFDQPNRSRHEWLNYFFYVGNALCHPSVLMRKKCYEEVGSYRQGFAQFGDFDMWIRLCLHYDIHVLPEKLVHFRVRDNEMNTSGNRPEAIIRSQFEYMQLLPNYLTITDVDEFTKIFPDSKKYFQQKEYDISFALAMCALEAGYAFSKLFGLTLLWAVINDKERAKLSKDIYNFSHLDLIELTAKFDVFSIIKLRELTNTIQEHATKIREEEDTTQSLSTLLGEKESFIQSLTTLLDEKENSIQSLAKQLNEKETTELNLTGDIFLLQQKLNSVHSSKSWRYTQPFRNMLSLVQNVKTEVLRSKEQPKPIGIQIYQDPPEPDIMLNQFHFTLEESEMNNGFVSLYGWAFHETWKIKQAVFLAKSTLGDQVSTAFNYKKERMDVFTSFPVQNAIHSGFWGKVQFPGYKSTANLVFKLENETQIIVDLGKFKDMFHQGSMSNYRNIVHWLKTAAGLISVLRIKKTLTHIARGDFLYISEKINSLLQESLDKQPLKNTFELADGAKLFHTPKSINKEKKQLDYVIDIIIPVYNGMEHLPGLFDSLLKNTYTPFRVIIVDDRSPDPAVFSFLENLAKQNSNILLLQNTENKGFVGTINHAAKFAENHFVILNTDVEVPKGWLQRLMGPIIYEHKIASVTPFTNAGTICSFPTPLVDNPLFGALDIQSIDSVFEKLDTSTISISLPTGVGFCMGVNIEAWRQIGPFNEELFGRGYGEENDWCMRASIAGYKNLMAPNLFVYHKHGGSFSSEEKKKLANENLQKLIKIYPNYQTLVEKFIKEDPAEPIRRFASLQLMNVASLRKTILVVDHEIGGGANLYRNQLVRERLQSGDSVLLLTFDTLQKSMKLQALYQDYEEIFFISQMEDIFILSEYLQITEIFYNNLVSFQNSLEMVNLIYQLQKRSGATLTIAMHDFYPLCTSYTLLDHTGQFCDLPSVEACKICLPENPYRNPDDTYDITKWRQSWAKILDVTDQIICFSESSAKLIRRIYDVEQKQISIKPHQTKPISSAKPKLNFQAPLNIGIVGSINFAKGAQMIVDVASLFAKIDPNVKVTVIGTLNGVPKSSNITITGRYDVSQLSNIIEKNKVNLCFLPSIVPETFSYVISELMELEMPICAFNLGAQAERIEKYKIGRIIHTLDAQHAADELIKLYNQLASSSKTK